MAWRRIEDEEFERDWLPIRRRIIGESLIFEAGDQPFLPANWRLTLVPGFFVYSSEFYGECCRKYAQPGQRDYADPLFWTWEELCIREVCCSNRTLINLNNVAPSVSEEMIRQWVSGFQALCDADRETLADMRPQIGHYFITFDRSGTWAVASCLDDITYVTGDERFMETYFRVSGGEEAIRRRFDHMMLHHGSFMIGGPDMDDHIFKEIYDDLLGWPQPDWAAACDPANADKILP